MEVDPIWFDLMGAKSTCTEISTSEFMRSLVVYYSRTGNTRFVAENIADFLDADVEEVIDKSDRSGPIGWIKSGFHATLEVDTEIEKLEYSPSNYDLVVLGSPVWNKRITPGGFQSRIRYWAESIQEECMGRRR